MTLYCHIAGRRIVDLGAQNLDNRDSSQGGKVRLQAQDTLNNTGGRISAEDALLLQAQNINLISITSTTGDAHNGRTVLDRVAGLYVTGGEGGQLVVDAAHNLQADGAEIANRSAGGQTVLQAGNALNLGTVGLARHESSDMPPDDDGNNKQRKGRPRSNVSQDKQVRDAARETRLTSIQRRELGRAVERESRKMGRNLNYQDILDIAKEVKNGTYY